MRGNWMRPTIQSPRVVQHALSTSPTETRGIPCLAPDGRDRTSLVPATKAMGPVQKRRLRTCRVMPRVVRTPLPKSFETIQTNWSVGAMTYRDLPRCQYPDCGREAVGRGWCRTHYMQARRTFLRTGVWPTELVPILPPAPCSKDCCWGKHYARGLCTKHYYRAYYHYRKTGVWPT